jgi:hypothetical protein
MKKLVLLMLIAGGSVFAQPNPQRPPPPTTNLPTNIDNGTNHAIMTLQMGLTELNLENQAHIPDTRLMAGVDASANMNSRILDFHAASTLPVERTGLFATITQTLTTRGENEKIGFVDVNCWRLGFCSA